MKIYNVIQPGFGMWFSCKDAMLTITSDGVVKEPSYPYTYKFNRFLKVKQLLDLEGGGWLLLAGDSVFYERLLDGYFEVETRYRHEPSAEIPYYFLEALKILARQKL